VAELVQAVLMNAGHATEAVYSGQAALDCTTVHAHKEQLDARHTSWVESPCLILSKLSGLQGQRRPLARVFG